MDILHNNSLINEIVDKLFKNRRTDYSEFALGTPHFTKKTLSHSAKCSIRFSTWPITTMKSCMRHSSKRHLIPSNAFSLCTAMDPTDLNAQTFCGCCPSSGHSAPSIFREAGRARVIWSLTAWKKNKTLVYVAWPRDSMLGHLRQTGYKRFVLWGRSMGATSALLYSLRYSPQDILLQVVDSPFYSFEMIAFEIASKNVKAPEFVISFALQLAKKNCAKFQYNPFDIDLKDVGECQVPALFLYC